MGCITVLPVRAPIKETIFKGSIEQVWMAAERVLADYPISESNVDSGVLHTDYLRGPNCWRSPVESEKYSAGIRCSLSLQILKIPHSGIRVRVHKSLQRVKDFVSEPVEVASDGLEEMKILYRIDRELSIANEISAKDL